MSNNSNLILSTNYTSTLHLATAWCNRVWTR